MGAKLTQLHPDVLELIHELKSMEVLLLEFGQDFWAGRICNVRQIAEKSDGRSIDVFLGFFGGMGSLTDIVLTVQSDPHKLSTIATPSNANSAFAGHRTRAYELAQSLR